MPKYDWETIEEFYIAGKVNPKSGTNEDYSFSDICRKFGGMTKATVKAQCDKRGWKAEREAYKRRHREAIRKELQEANIPTIVEIRQTILQAELATVRRYIELLKTGEVEVKPLDALRAGEFIIAQYHILYGIQEEKKPDQDINLHIDFKDEDELYRAANEYVRKKSDGS